MSVRQTDPSQYLIVKSPMCTSPPAKPRQPPGVRELAAWGAVCGAGSACRRQTRTEGRVVGQPLRQPEAPACHPTQACCLRRSTGDSLRSVPLHRCGRLPVVNYRPFLATSAPRKPVRAIVAPRSICRQTEPTRSSVRESVPRSQFHGTCGPLQTGTFTCVLWSVDLASLPAFRPVSVTISSPSPGRCGPHCL